MDAKKERCKLIISELIKKSFGNSIKGVWFIYIRKKGFSANIHNPFGYVIIGIHKDIINLPKKLLMGVFAHELSHPEITKKLGTIKNLFLSIFSHKKYLEMEEKNVDILAIDKGYGKNLFMFREWREKNKDKIYWKNKNIYLNSTEINEYIRLKKLPKLKFSKGNLKKL